MSHLKEIVRKLKNRVPIEEVYMIVLEHIYSKIFLDYIHYYYYFNSINLERVAVYAYNNYFITWDNMRDFKMNIIDILLYDFLFMRSDECPYSTIKPHRVLNNFHTKQSRLFNTIIESKPEYNNFLFDLTEVKLKDFIIDVNYIYTLLHPDSVLYKLINENSYEDVLNKLSDFMIENKIAVRIDKIINKDIILPISIFNYPIGYDDYSVPIDEEDSVRNLDFIEMSMFYSGFIDNWDILNHVYGKTQLRDTYIDDFYVSKNYMEYDSPRN